MVIKVHDALRLVVLVVGGIHHMTVPERVVGDDESPRPQDAHHHLVALDIRALVAIDERHVELYSEFRGLRQRVADDELDTVGHLRALDPGPREVLHLVVDLERVEPSALRQTLRHRDGAIAAERPHFEHPLWLYHLHQHLQQSSLQVSAGHPSVNRVHVRRPPQPVQILRLRLRVPPHVVL